MNEIELGELLLSLSLVFALTYALGYLFSGFRIPSILAALFVGITLSYTPFSAFVHSITAFESTFTFLADLGVLFLLFYIGLQIDLREMKRSSSDIVSVFMLISRVLYKWMPVIMKKWEAENLSALMVFSLVLLFGFGGLGEYVELGMLAASSFAAITVPLLFSLLIRFWGEEVYREK